MKTLFSNYAIYITSTGLKTVLFYYLSVAFTRTAFIGYTNYMSSADIFITIVSAGTLTAFAQKGKNDGRIGTALAFETAFLLLLLLGAFVLKSAGIFNLQLNFLLLAVLAWCRMANQAFCRYLLFFKSMPASILNDILGNYLWIIGLFVLVQFFGVQAVEPLLWVWIFTLVVNNGVNIYAHRDRIFTPAAIEGFRKFFKVYLSSFHFTLVIRLFGTAEKLLVIHKFKDIHAVSSFLISSKVLGFGSELTGGFVHGLATSRLNSIGEGHRGEKKYLLRMTVANIIVYAGIALGTFLFAPVIQMILKTQLSESYRYFPVLLVPIYAVTQIHQLVGLYFQRYGKLWVLQGLAVLQVILFIALYKFNLTIYQFIGLEVAGFVLMLLIDLAAFMKLKVSDSPTDNSGE